MLDVGNTPVPLGSNELSMRTLLALLKAHAGKRLVFHYEGRDIRSGYHITEVKSGSFIALDCGANPESWTELFVQLLDVSGDGQHMAAGKFAAIIGKVHEHFELDDAAKLTFEVSNGLEPMRLFMATASETSDVEIRLSLSPRVASCKPRDRWMAQEKAALASSACCSASKSDSERACCVN